MDEKLTRHIIEAAADCRLRADMTCFEHERTDDEALRLWKKYAAADRGDEAVKKAAILSGGENVPEELFRLVRASKPVSFYFSRKGFEWLPVLTRILDTYAQMRDGVDIGHPLCSRISEPGEKVLCTLILPFIQEAADTAAGCAPACSQAGAAAAEELFKRMEPVCNQVFLVAARRFCGNNSISLSYLADDPEKLEGFTRWVYEGGINELAEHYPVCFRLLAERQMIFLQNIRLFFSRIRKDREELRARFGGGCPMEQLTDITFSLSDSHNGGQNVIIAEFDHAVRIVYKPRDMMLDAAWNRFLTGLGRRDPAFRLRSCEVLSREGYGYETFITRSACTSVEEYYYNAGTLLCLASLFGATDLHYENIIACGNSPVIVDLETIITPCPRSRFAMIDADRILSATVDIGHTLLLSKWVGSTLDGAREIGGFVSRLPEGKNYPDAEGGPFSADEYPEAFLQGFENAYRYILDHDREVLALFDTCGFSKCTYRFVFRRTALYVKLTRHFLQAPFLKRMALYEAVLSRMGAGILVSFDLEDARMLHPIEQSEEKAVFRGDIPYFFCRGDSTAISDFTGELVPEFFETAPAGIFRRNIGQMSSKRLNYEKSYISKSLVLSHCQPQEAGSTPLSSYRDIVRNRRRFNEEQICSEIHRLHGLLEEYCIDGLDFAYYAPVRNPETTRYNLALLENTFYSGIWGVLLFHAAYAVWTDNEVLRNKVVSKIHAQLKPLIEGEDQSAFLRIGMADGVAGVIEGLICLSCILEDNGLLDKAAAIAARVKKEYILRSSRQDLFGGTAGFLYVLCRLYLQTKSDALLEPIRFCTQHLSRSAQTDERTGLAVFKTGMEYAPLTGLAHGQAGYLMALTLARHILKDESLSKLIESAARYEEQSYDPGENNWYDYRRFLVLRRDQDLSEHYQKRFMYGTCSGTPGMGMSRIVMERIAPGGDNRKVIDDAVRFCTDHHLVGCDTYCCGNMGWADFLIEASILQSREDLMQEAKTVICSLNPKLSGENYVLSNLKGIYDISLFTGISGIGYEMLRTMMPDRFPSPIMLGTGRRL